MKSINKTPLQSYLLTKNPSLLPPEVPNFSFPLTISSIKSYEIDEDFIRAELYRKPNKDLQESQL